MPPGKPPQVGLAFELAFRDGGFGGEIQHKGMIRQEVHSDQRGYDLRRIQQQVIGQAIMRQQTHAAQMCPTKGEIRVWQVKNQLKKAIETGFPLSLSHKAQDRRMGHLKGWKIVGLLDRIAGLHGAGAVNALRIKKRFQVGGAKVAEEGG